MIEMLPSIVNVNAMLVTLLYNVISMSLHVSFGGRGSGRERERERKGSKALIGPHKRTSSLKKGDITEPIFPTIELEPTPVDLSTVG